MVAKSKTGTNLVIVEAGERQGVFLCPIRDVPLMGSGRAWEVECRVYFDHVTWQDAEGYRVWCIPLPPGMGRTQLIEAIRHRAERSGVVRVEIFNVMAPLRTSQVA